MKSNIEHMYSNKNVYADDSRSELIDFLPKNINKALDIGCGLGAFGSLLKSNFSSEVWGIDINPKAVETAKSRLDKVICGDINEILVHLPDAYFDVIFFNDVLEHLVNPYELLNKIKSKLSKSGVVIASIPNILYFRVLRNLLFEKDWIYEDSGVLDNTHLRFFTKKSMIRMFEEQGYEVLSVFPIKKTKSFMPYFLMILTFGLINNECKYINFVLVAKPKI